MNRIKGKTSGSQTGGQFYTYVEIDRPSATVIPVKMKASNFCAFRGLLWKSDIFFCGKAGFCLGNRAKAKFIVGSHPRVQKLKALNPTAAGELWKKYARFAGGD